MSRALADLFLAGELEIGNLESIGTKIAAPFHMQGRRKKALAWKGAPEKGADPCRRAFFLVVFGIGSSNRFPGGAVADLHAFDRFPEKLAFELQAILVALAQDKGTFDVP